LYGEEPYIGYSDYQIVTNKKFDASSYFQKMQQSGVNLQRIWVLGYSNTSSNIKEQMPFRKERRNYNLNELDPEYLQRLQTVMEEAKQNGQTVMLTLFDRWSMGDAALFSRTPWYYKNNTDKLLQKPFPTFYDLSDPKLVAVQKNLVQGIVKATAEFHPIYEIMNEARWPDCKIITEFHNRVAKWILESDPDATIAVNVLGSCTAVYKQDWVDLISLHASDWMKDGICPTITQYRDLGKPILIDTDGAFKTRVDNVLVRKWVQETLSCGGWFNHKDDIYQLDTEALSAFREERQLMLHKTRSQ
jgi:hypothetical protein